MVGSITWPYFGPKFCYEIWPGYWPYFFHTFFVKTFFSKISFSMQKEEDFWKTKKTKNNKKQMARLLTYAGQVIDPTAYIYIYIWLWGCLPPQKMSFLSFFPQFYSKNGQKEMLQICPVSVSSRSIEITQNWLETAVPSLFFKKSDWDCNFRPFYWFILGLNVKFMNFLARKRL